MVKKHTRDMSEKEFRAALKRNGFGEPQPPLYYVSLPEPNNNIHVCMFNGGRRYRDILAYLIQEARKEQTR